MPGSMDDEQQKRDQWGTPLPGEYLRTLGRMESKLDEHGEALRDLKRDAKQSKDDRDKAFAEIENRVRANAHKTANDFQVLGNRVEGLDGKLVNVQVSVDTANKRMEQQAVELAGASTRLGKLEAPFAEAMAARDAQRARWRRWLMWATGALLFIWGGLEPIYKTVVPVAVQRWLHLGGP